MFNIDQILRKVGSNEEIAKGENLLRYSSFNHDYENLYIDRDVRDENMNILPVPTTNNVLCYNAQQVITTPISNSLNVTISSNNYDENYNSLNIRFTSQGNGKYINMSGSSSAIFHTWNMHNISGGVGGSYPKNKPVAISMYVQSGSALAKNAILKCKLGGNYSNEKPEIILCRGINSKYQRVYAIINPDYEWNDLILWVEANGIKSTNAINLKIAKPKLEFGKEPTTWNESTYDMINNTEYNNGNYNEYDPEYFRQAGDTDSDVLQKAHNHVKACETENGKLTNFRYGVLKLSRSYTLTRTFKWDASFVNIIGNGYAFYIDIPEVGTVKQYGILIDPTYNIRNGGSPINNKVIKINSLMVIGVNYEGYYDEKGKRNIRYTANGILFEGRNSVVNSSNLCLDNIVIMNLHEGVTLSNNTYMIEFKNINFTNNKIHINYLQNVTNSGERITFCNCNFGGQDSDGESCVISNLSTGELFFHQCSFDWIRHLFYNTGYLVFSNCHIEIPYYTFPSPIQYVYTEDEKYSGVLYITEFNRDANGYILTDDKGRYTYTESIKKSRPYIRIDSDQTHFFGENMGNGMVHINDSSFIINAYNPTVTKRNLIFNEADKASLTSLKADETEKGILAYNNKLLEIMKRINRQYKNTPNAIFANDNFMQIRNCFLMTANADCFITDFDKDALYNKFEYKTQDNYTYTLPATVQCPSIVPVGDNYVYIFNTSTTEAYKYDISSNKHYSLPNMPVKIGGTYNLESAVYIAPYVYFLTSSSTECALYSFNVDTEKYEKLINIGYITSCPKLVSIDNYIYIFGDYTGGNPVAAYKYDIVGKTINRLQDIPFMFVLGGICAVNKKIYLFGSNYKNSSNVKEFGKTAYEYDPVTNTYRQLLDIPYIFSSGSCCKYVNGTEYGVLLIGGNESKNVVYRYMISTNSYTICDPISSNLEMYGCMSINSNDRIILSKNNILYRYSLTNSSKRKILKFPNGQESAFMESIKNKRAGRNKIDIALVNEYNAFAGVITDATKSSVLLDPLYQQITTNNVYLDDYKTINVLQANTPTETINGLVIENIANEKAIKLTHNSIIGEYSTLECKVSTSTINLNELLTIKLEMYLPEEFANNLYGYRLSGTGNLVQNANNSSYVTNDKTGEISVAFEFYTDSDKLLIRKTIFSNKEAGLSVKRIDCNNKNKWFRLISKQQTLSSTSISLNKNFSDDISYLPEYKFNYDNVSYMKILVRTKDVTTAVLKDKSFYIKGIDVQGC